MPPGSLSLDAMIGLPPLPSPAKEPARAPSPTDRPDPRRSTSPSPPTGATVHSRKRPAEDMSQYAAEVSCAHKLAKADHDELSQFAKGKIDDNSAALLTDFSLPAYRSDKVGPGKLLMDILKQSPSWGFALRLHDEQEVVDAIYTQISKSLTAKRNLIKSAISGSLGSDPAAETGVRPGALDIVELTSLIITKLKVRSVTVNVMFCGRVSVLRKIFTEHDDNTFWSVVNKQLAALRKEYPDAKELSRFIKQFILDPDLDTYGRVDLQSLDAGPTVVVASPPAVPVDSGSGQDNNNDD
ncbi:hypothetical protein C8R43DRAFT_1135861 [Mycena crocata]|nr:hypothetical protein C8R43DRAFT_1135861 [Mycena crocata]